MRKIATFGNLLKEVLKISNCIGRKLKPNPHLKCIIIIIKKRSHQNKPGDNWGLDHARKPSHGCYRLGFYSVIDRWPHCCNWFTKGIRKCKETTRFPEFVICFGWKCRQQQQQQQQQHISVTFFFNIRKIEESLRSRKTWFEDITQSQPLAPIRTENNSLPLKINPKKKNVMRIWKWTVIDAKYYTKLTAIKNMKHARYYL